MDLGILKTDYPHIYMHPHELIKTQFGRVCLVKPFEYSEISEPFDKLSYTHPSANLTIKFHVEAAENLSVYDVGQYLSGVLHLCEQRLNQFGKS